MAAKSGNSTNLKLQVENDYLEKLARVKPVDALAECVWNALDADAENVDIRFEQDATGLIESIEIEDDGHGLPREDALQSFGRLGGSWKMLAHRSKDKNRLLHGKSGQGRFRAFAIGREQEWIVRYRRDQTTFEYRIQIAGALQECVIGEERKVREVRTGVRLRIRNLVCDAEALRDNPARERLSQHLALYLRAHPVKVSFDGILILSREMERRVVEFDLAGIPTASDGIVPARLVIVEWTMKVTKRLYLCNRDGVPVEEIEKPSIAAPGFSFTAYVQSEYFERALERNSIDLHSMDPATVDVLREAKARARDYFLRRAAEESCDLVETWKRENLYPYEDQPRGPVEELGRKVFDVVALNVSSYLPHFSEAEQGMQRLQLKLLRHAVESNPHDALKIIQEVFNLTEEKQRELSELLDRTTLADMITATKTVTDRLEFLRGLETLLFDPEFKPRVRERSELHKLVGENIWMFGEQYSLSVNDQSLTEVLRKHLESSEVVVDIDEPVLRDDGSRGIVDLMLSRSISRLGENTREHLVLELKRPNVLIGGDVLTQTERYAFAVANDERFRGVDAKWVFWAIATDMDGYARTRASQAGRPRGLVHQDDRVAVWAKTWGEVIEDNKKRLLYFQEKLGYVPTRDRGIEHLQKAYSRHLGKIFEVA